MYKATLKKNLGVERSSRFLEQAEVTVVDGCAVLWIISRPSRGSVENFIKNIIEYISNILQKTTKVVLTVKEIKVKLIGLVCQYLQENAELLPQNGRKLITTGRDSVPKEIQLGNVMCKPGMKTLHEKSDVNIEKQVLFLTSSGVGCIKVISDDTDVFMLLMHYYLSQKLTCKIFMEGTSPSRSTIDIKATVEKHRDLVADIMAAHALSGCNTVAHLCGIGKVTAMQTLKSGHRLDKLGKIVAEITEVVAARYDSQVIHDMPTVRFDVLTSKMFNKRLTSAPELRYLPPTTAAFELHVLRAHYQTMIWRSPLEVGPPNHDPRQYGWSSEQASNLLVPVPLPSDVSTAPDIIQKLIKCSCSANRPCSAARCTAVVLLPCYHAPCSCPNTTPTPQCLNTTPTPQCLNTTPTPQCLNTTPTPQCLNTTPPHSAQHHTHPTVPQHTPPHSAPTPHPPHSAPTPHPPHSAPTPHPPHSAPTPPTPQCPNTHPTHSASTPHPPHSAPTPPTPQCPNTTPTPQCPNTTPTPQCPNTTPTPQCPNTTPTPQCPNTK
ncbi:hypothetical protein Hamer_G014467 [Homarus americanus]|uniref:Uncharacterized protein n=1 Tax=Homarus americanus TaxID=6706 RepID=A0A8J5MUP3_HOMAM|nr:hypothetical protein Hamer_G014467 [Homarus americanus]